MPSDSPTLPIDSEMPSASPVDIETEGPIKAPTDVATPSCPPIDTGGKSGIVNGGSGIAEEYKNMKSGDKRGKVAKETEDMDRYLRTGGLECPEPSQPDTTTKKKTAKDDVDKSPKEDVMKNSKTAKKKESPTKKKDDSKQNGKMDVSTKESGKGSSGKGTNTTSTSKAGHEKSMMYTMKYNSTSPIFNAKVGKGKGDTGSDSSVQAPSKTPLKGERAKVQKGSTEDLDDDEKDHSSVRQL